MVQKFMKKLAFLNLELPSLEYQISQKGVLQKELVKQIK